jgi:hypothetical protein
VVNRLIGAFEEVPLQEVSHHPHTQPRHCSPHLRLLRIPTYFGLYTVQLYSLHSYCGGFPLYTTTLSIIVRSIVLVQASFMFHSFCHIDCNF